MVKIFVGNLAPEATSYEMRILFEKFGQVTECDVKKNYGFVHMPAEDDADIAIEALNEYLLHGVRMKVEKSHGKAAAGAPGHREKRKDTIKIFLGNLSVEAKATEVSQLFSQFGKVVECDVMKNYGFVHMEKQTDADAAISALNGFELHGSEMKVELSHSKPSKSDSSKSLKTIKLFIGNVNPETTSEELQELFEKFGRVTECEVKRNYGFVHMDAIEDALSAIDALNEYQLHGKNIKVEMSKAKSSGGFHPAYSQQTNQGPVKLFVGNLSSEHTTKQELQTLFEKFGSVMECDVIKNYGFVHMDTEENATAAIETLKDCYFHSNKMRVERSQPKQQQDEGFEFGGGYQERGFDRFGGGGGRFRGRDGGFGNRDGGFGGRDGGFGNRDMGFGGRDDGFGGGRGGNRGGGRGGRGGRFEPYGREDRNPFGGNFDKPFPSFNRRGEDYKQPADYPPKRPAGFIRSSGPKVLPPPPDSGYDHEGEYERYLKWRDGEWSAFWQRQQHAGGQMPVKNSRGGSYGNSNKMDTSGGGFAYPQQSSLYTAF